MFGFSSAKRKEATQSALEAVSALCGPYTREVSLSEIASTDPYIAGFLSTRIPNICALVAGELGLDHSDVKEIHLQVVETIYEDQLPNVLSFAKTMIAARDSKYLAGQECGRLFLRYVTGKADIRDDPDFSEAMEIAASVGLPKSSDISVALAGLDRIWFGRRMEEFIRPSANEKIAENPNAPDFAQCEPIREYELGEYLCVLFKEPPAVSARLAPNVQSVSFTFAMVIIGKDKNVRLTIAGEKPHPNAIRAKMGLPASSDNRAFLCVTDAHGERENFGKHEGLDIENVFAAAALAIAANRLDIPDAVAYSSDGGSRIALKDDSDEPEYSEDEDDGLEDEEFDVGEDDPSSDDLAAAENLFFDLSAKLEEARADGDVSLAVKLQLQIYENQTSAVARTLEEIASSGTGSTQDDLLLAVEETRADGDTTSAAQLQFAIDSYRCHALVESLLSIAEHDLGKLSRLNRLLTRAESQGDVASAERALEQAMSIVRTSLSCPAPIDSLDVAEILHHIRVLVSEAEEARADADTSLAYKTQRRIDDAFAWLAAAKLFTSRTRR